MGTIIGVGLAAIVIGLPVFNFIIVMKSRKYPRKTE